MTGKIEITNQKEAIKAFEKVLAVSRDEARRVIDEGLLMLIGDVSEYPPPPQGSTYRRTGTLGRKWTTGQAVYIERDNLIEGRVGNDTPYGPYVQSKKDQATIHKGRWKTIEDIVRDRQGDFEGLLKDAARNIERRFS